MHRDQSLRMKLEKCFHGFLGIHMNFAASGRFISANGQQCDLDLVAITDFIESREVSAVAAMKNHAAIRRGNKAAKITMRIRQETSAPLMTRRERKLKLRDVNRLP